MGVLMASSGPQINDAVFDDLLVTTADLYPNLHPDLKKEKRFLVFRYAPKPGATNGRKNKVPYDVRTGKPANSAELGMSFEDAVVASEDYDGIGFYLGGGWWGADYDECVVNGTVFEKVAAVIRAHPELYWEASVSGTGVHCIGRGSKPGKVCRVGNAEIYDSDRFFTISGFAVGEQPSTLGNADFTDIYISIARGDFAESAEEKSATSERTTALKESVHIQHTGSVVTGKYELFMRGTVSGDKPTTISDGLGNSVTYDDRSAIDMAFCNEAAIKHNGDADKIWGDYKRSAIYRERWGEREKDFRNLTIAKAIASYDEKVAATKTQAEVFVTNDDEEEFGPDVEEKMPPFPQFTGVLNDLCEALSPDIPYAFKMSAALTHFGLIRSGLDTLLTEPHLQPRLFTVLVAEPGRGKTAAINEVGKTMTALGRGSYKSFSSIDSGPSLVDAFQDINREHLMSGTPEENLSLIPRPARILLSPDEAKDIFEKGKSGANMRNSFLGELLKLYEANITGNHARGAKTKIQIENAHLALVGGATLSGYRAMWYCTQGASEGLQSRIIPIGSDASIMPGRQRPADAEKLNIAFQNLMEIVKHPAQQFDVIDSAWATYDDWWNQKDQAKPSVTRLNDIVKKVAIILAATNGRSIIDDSIMSQGIQFADYILESRQRNNPKDATTLTQAMENAIIDCYTKHGDMSANKCRRVLHPYRLPGGSGVFKQAFQNLIAVGYLREIAKTYKTKVYRLNM